MNIIPIGIGQGGCNMVDDLVQHILGVEQERSIQIFPRDASDIPAVFAINLGKGDLVGLSDSFPIDNEHRIILGQDEFRGRGAGKDNIDGAKQINLEKQRVIEIVKNRSRGAVGADAFFIFASTAGGSGSGGVSVLGDALKDAFPGKGVYVVLILPFSSDYNEAAAMVNTATCLNEVLNYSRVDATIIVDNEHFVRMNESARENLELINRMFAHSITDLLCAGEETEREYIGQMVDAKDIMNTMVGVTAIGASYDEIPKQPKRIGRRSVQKDHFLAAEGQTQRSIDAVNRALENLSVDCGYEENYKTYYDAGRVLTLFVGPDNKATQGIVDMIDHALAQRIPEGKDVRRVKGTYPLNLKDSIGTIVVISDIGRGAVSDLIKEFYRKGNDMYTNVAREREEREKYWADVAKAAEGLPRLRGGDR